jgi:cytoskeletal protein RodZ
VSIGDALAEGRRQAGLTITQVSQRTCIRETIIRGIERGDFSGCGGDFYARGHIRSIARSAGVDPEPLIEEYDSTMGAPHAISAADVFQPVTPVKLKERRRPNWTAALALALILVAGVFGYQHFASRPAATVAAPAAKTRATLTPHHARTHPVHHAARHLDIRLAATQNCWVQLSTLAGRTLFSGVVYAGTSMNWVERHAVTMVIGNPSAVRLRVNGKNPVPPGSVNSVTLSLHAGRA